MDRGKTRIEIYGEPLLMVCAPDRGREGESGRDFVIFSHDVFRNRLCYFILAFKEGLYLFLSVELAKKPAIFVYATRRRDTEAPQ